MYAKKYAKVDATSVKWGINCVKRGSTASFMLPLYIARLFC